MPPRPRPKPRPQEQISQIKDTNGAPSTSSVPRDQDDPFFIKRLNTWDEIDRKAKRAREAELRAEREQGASLPISDLCEVVESQEDLDSPDSKQMYISNIKPLPAWARTTKSSRKQAPISVDTESSESDQDHSQAKQSSGTNLTPRPGRYKKGKKQSRSRSRSLTPPPTLSQRDLSEVQDVLIQRPLMPNNSFVDASTIDLTIGEEGENLDPELLRIKESLKNSNARESSVEGYSSCSEDEDNPRNQVLLVVNWIHNPDENHPNIIKNEMEFPYQRSKNFQKLFDTLSDVLSLPASQMVLLYDNRRVYPGSSPDLLKMWGTARLMACEYKTLPYIQSGRIERASSSVPMTPVPFERRSSSVVSEIDESTEKVKVIIRSSTVEIPLRVRVTTTCEELVAKFLSKTESSAGSSLKKKPILCLDGEKLSGDTTLASLDIEDGDLLEISNV